MTLRKKQNIGNLKRKHYNAICGGLVFKDTIDLSQDVRLGTLQDTGMIKGSTLLV
jgi:hypothetical protein